MRQSPASLPAPASGVVGAARRGMQAGLSGRRLRNAALASLLFAQATTPHEGPRVPVHPPGPPVILKAPAVQGRPWEVDPSTQRFFDDLVVWERPFFAPDVAYDVALGVTVDGLNVKGDDTTRRYWSAASKEFFQLALSVKALEGERTARELLAPEGLSGTDARVEVKAQTVELLRRKIGTYERYNRSYPGFGGFLTWYQVKGDHIEPTWDWQRRVPSLDVGLWAWGLLAVEHELRVQGEDALADRYRHHLQLLEKNAVRIFYNAQTQTIRTEAQVPHPTRAPDHNDYQDTFTSRPLVDSCEGLAFRHWISLFADWTQHPRGKDAIWALPSRELVTDPVSGVSVIQGDTFGSHEEFGFLFMPSRDLPVAQSLLQQAARLRTLDAHRRDLPALTDATNMGEQYLNALGVQGAGRVSVSSVPVVAPGADYAIALSGRSDAPEILARWLRTLTKRYPQVVGQYGLRDGLDAATGRVSGTYTWDGKAPLLLALPDRYPRAVAERIGVRDGDVGIVPQVRTLLKERGLYEAFLERERADYRDVAQHIASTDSLLAEPPSLITRHWDEVPEKRFDSPPRVP